MATINEDYVSFETAKLLKEKGFDAYGDGSFDSSIKVWMEYSPFGKIRDISTATPSVKGFPAPTLQMAMKWLRIKHSLSVEVYRTACGYVGCIVAIPSGTDIKFLEEDGDDLPSGTYTKWEYACEAGIKYCLENLI